MNKLKYDIQRSFGGWCISIDNGYTVTYQYDVNDNIIAIIKQLAEENEELKSKMKQASEMLNHPWTFESGNKEVDEETHRRKLEVMKLLWEEENG